MSEYKYFATVYDRMMDDIPYEEWEQYVLLLLCKHGIKPCSKLLELGCGTGTISGLLTEDGFEVTGIDISEEMLQMAKEKNAKNNINYICHDMRDFSLPEKHASAISLCDSMNYLLTVDDLARTMTAVRNNLEPGGIFVFDLKTEHFYMDKLDGYVFTDDLGDFSYTWKNYYDTEKCIHEYYLKFKIRDDSGYRYEKELHRQKAFSASEIKEAALRAGFKKAVAYDAFTLDKPKKNSDRIYIVCKG